MATTYADLDGNGQASRSFSFPSIKEADIKVEVDNVTYENRGITGASSGATTFTITSYTTTGGGNIVFDTAPAGSANKIRIYRDTDVDSAKATFTAGSAVKAADLNNNMTQILYAAQEEQNQTILTSDIKNAAVTTAKIAADNITAALIADDQINSEHYVAGSIDHEHLANDIIDGDNIQDDVINSEHYAAGSIDHEHLANDIIDGDNIQDNAINSEHYTDGSIDREHLAADIVDGTKLADNAVNSEHITAGSVDLSHMSANSVDSDQYVDGSIDRIHLEADIIDSSKLADNAVNSEHYVDASIDHVHLASDVIDGDNIQDDVINSEHIAAGAVDLEHMSANSVDSDQYVDGSIDGVHIANDAIDSQHYAAGSIDLEHMSANSVDSDQYVDGSIDSIHIADNAVIGSKIAANVISNAKMMNDAITQNEIADNAVVTAGIANDAVTTNKLAADAITGAKIADDAVDSEHLAADSIDSEHYAAGSVDNTALGADAVTGAKIADNAIDSEHYVDLSIDTAHIGSAQVTDAKLATNSVTTGKITDSNVTTAKIADSNVTLAKLASDLKQTSISNSNTQLPTSGAVVSYVAAQIAPLGGLEVIATEVAFPNTQPASGVVISISDAGGVVFNGSGVSTTGRTVGGSTVTINGAPSSLYSETLAAGVGLMVSSTGSSQTYNYHKILGKEDDIKQLSDDINDFQSRYRVSGSAPTSSLDNGDLWFDTTNGKMMVYNSTNTAWEEVSAIGSFNINTLSSSGNTGGGSATFNGSAYRFTLSNPPQDAQQLLVSINGVIQKPNAGSSQPSEGFAVSGNDIIFSAAPPSGSTSFIITLGQAVQIGTPSDGSVSTAKLASGAVTTAKIADDAVTTAKIADDAVTSANIANLDGNLIFNDSIEARFGTDNDMQISHNGSNAYIVNKVGDLNIYAKTGEAGAVFVPDGTSKLYFDGSKKIETTSTGIFVNGDIDGIPDGSKLLVGTHDDLQLYHTSNASYIKASNHTIHLDSGTTSAIRIISGGSTTYGKMADFNTDGSVDLYYDNTLRLETRANDVKFHGGLVGVDNVKLQLGSSGDLQLYHDGTNSYIDNINVGILRIRGNTAGQIELQPKGGEYGVITKPNSATELYFDHSKKLETVSGGVYVYGQFIFGVGTSDALHGGDNNKIILGSGNDLQIHHDGSNSKLQNSGGRLHIENSAGNIRTQTNHGFFVMSADGNTTHAEIDNEGLKFNGDTAGDNALNDYEVGTFSSLLNGGNFTASQGYNRYIKIGKMVYVSGRLGSFSSTTNNSTIEVSLPFAVANVDSVFMGNSVWNQAGASDMQNEVAPRAIQNTSTLQFLVQSAGSGSWFWLRYYDLHGSNTACQYHITYQTT